MADALGLLPIAARKPTGRAPKSSGVACVWDGMHPPFGAWRDAVTERLSIFALAGAKRDAFGAMASATHWRARTTDVKLESGASSIIMMVAAASLVQTAPEASTRPCAVCSSATRRLPASSPYSGFWRPWAHRRARPTRSTCPRSLGAPPRAPPAAIWSSVRPSSGGRTLSFACIGIGQKGAAFLLSESGWCGRTRRVSVEFLCASECTHVIYASTPSRPHFLNRAPLYYHDVVV